MPSLSDTSIDLNKVIENIKRQNKLILKSAIILILTLIFIMFTLILISISAHEPFIEKNIKVKSFKKLDISSIFYDTKTTIFSKKNEKLIIKSKEAITKRTSNVNILYDCFIKTPPLRYKRIYTGNTDTISMDTKDNTIQIPNEIYLTNKDNGNNNYIIATNVYGKLDDYLKSDNSFKVNDDDLFISGDDFFFKIEKNFFKINKNSNIIYTKLNVNNNQKTKPDVFDVKSIKMDFFGDDGYAIFKKNVIFHSNEYVIKSQFGKVYFDENQRPKDVFISNDVNIDRLNESAKSDFGFLSVEKKLLILYKNVTVTSSKNSSNGHLYVYNIDNKTITSFNEYTVLKDRDNQNEIFNILRKLANELSPDDKRYILYVIEQNKENIKNKTNHNSDNHNIDREKRVKVELINN